MDLILVKPYLPIIAGLISGIITYFLIPSIIRISYKKHLCDDPTLNHRKQHLHKTPTLGGVAIFASVLFTFILTDYEFHTWTPYLATGLIILFFSGIKDDITSISALNKLLLQVIAVALIIVPGGLVITNLGGVFGVHQIPYWAGILLTGFTMIVVLNAYNLIDGVDGLAGGIGVIACAFFAWWFWVVGMVSVAIIAITLGSSLLCFLWYNFSPASIFMGDTGSQIVGFLLSFFAVKFVSSGVTATVNVPLQNIIPVLVLSVLIVPLYDTLRVFIIRATKGSSPFRPDRLHVHHQFLDSGLNHKWTCVLVYSINVAIIALTILLPQMNINVLLGIVLLSAVLLFPTIHLKRKILEHFGLSFPDKKRLQSATDKSREEDKRIAI